MSAWTSVDRPVETKAAAAPNELPAVVADGAETLRNGRGSSTQYAPELRSDADVSILFGDRSVLERPPWPPQLGSWQSRCGGPSKGSVPSSSEVERIVATVADERLFCVLFNLYSGSVPAGERGLSTVSRQRPRFRDNVDVAVEIAGPLGGSVLNARYGNVNPDIRDAARQETGLDNLDYAAKRAATVGASVVLA